ncbi:MAG: FAD-dependent thymidylate synthase [Clostridia bacterium]|nr:FAD-dependent thymidylate synthase [Clostridia bacterium]MBQ6121548.1 FAD-dependent thymidylate synthase [Clostridia bacterium]
MKIIKPSFQLCERDEQRGGLKIIEEAGRLCYKSEDKTTDTSAEAFVRGLIRRKHLSVLEHGDMIFEIGDHHIYDAVIEGLGMIADAGHHAPMLITTNIGHRCIISGNIRAWLELFALGSLAGRYFIGYFDPVFIQGMAFMDEDAEPDDRVRQIHYADLRDPLEKMAHLRQTVKFTVDRGVTHEFVRHRVMSFSQESTRYCNYSDGRFGSEITVIRPCFLEEGTEPWSLWKRQCMSAETAYFTLLNMGLLSEEARDVLPHSTKAELMMTGTLGAWDHFFDLRARQVTGKAHPQAAEVAIPLYELFKVLYPGIII